jgi:hypothetical protein
MAIPKIRELGPAYTSEVDTVDEQTWFQILQQFDDANIYQTWSYGAVISGRRNISHLVLRENGDIAAIAQARIARLPLVNMGIAYVLWGPLWRRGQAEASIETFRQAIRALRNEYVCRRGLVLRIFPILFDDDAPRFSTILAAEGFSVGKGPRGRTILMDLSPTLKELREGMGGMWKRNLKLAERQGLEVVECSSDELFGAFTTIYKEMVSRKAFVEPNDINQFRLIQAQLPEKFKMKIMLAKSGEDVCAGLICSAIGKTAVYLFGATSNKGMKNCGSYVLHWKLLADLKRTGFAIYDLNGINPVKNPGTYKFKADLAGKKGKDVYYLGRFDSRSSFLSSLCIEFGDTARACYRKLKELAKSAQGVKLWPKAAS